jgi:Cft2 family RNA processing exonuclease
VELGEFRILVDGGMSPKDLGRAALPDYTRVPAGSIDLIIVTHCHLDHIGSLPCVHRAQPRARVLMTPASKEILPTMLQNSHTVMVKQREEKGVADYPLFSRSEATAVGDDIFPMHFGKSREFTKKKDRIRVTFYPAGHVMGAACVLIEHGGKKYFFTGDILFRRQHTLEGAQIPAMEVDTLIMETTRGLAEHGKGFSYEGELDRLFKVVRETLDGGGSCLLPVFALGRMQEVLTLVQGARCRGLLPGKFPVYCSGLGLAIVDVFEKIGKNRNSYGLDFHPPAPMAPAPVLQDLKHRMAPSMPIGFRKRVLNDLNVRPLPLSRIKAGVDIKKPSLFIMSSGMLVENSPSYRVAASLLPFAHNAIAFTGYCDPATPGGRLLAAPHGDNFSFDVLDFQTPIRARVERFDLSGHADREDLIHLVRELGASTVVLTHGEADAREWFAGALQRSLPDVKVANPEPQESYQF